MNAAASKYAFLPGEVFAQAQCGNDVMAWSPAALLLAWFVVLAAPVLVHAICQENGLQQKEGLLFWANGYTCVALSTRLQQIRACLNSSAQGQVFLMRTFSKQ